MDKYWHLVGKGRGVRIADEPARTLQKGVVATLYGAWDELRSHANRELTRRDMVLVSSDAERYLSNADAYFQEWAWMVGMAVLGGVEKFHHALSSRGYTLDFIPVVVPVIPFPSTDLLIAVARNRQGGGLPERGADPRRLKLALYGTEHLMSLRPEDLHERALKHISADAILAMYSAVPEVRPLLHWLCWASDGA
ncbi:MAG: hypothetical protein FJ290_17510 [Planctomycetes bacterium]|nr:hypothetical protein [Planctomycetota bacterium]